MTARPLIVGAGPAGSAAAIGLARLGHRPLMLDRGTETGDAICGGFLSWRTLDALDRLGLPVERISGSTASELRLFNGRRTLSVALPQSGMGVSRHRLDTLMQERALAAGAELLRGVMVRRAVPSRVEAADGRIWESPTILVATGKHALPGHPRPAPPPARDDPVAGLRLRLPPSPALDALIGGAIELYLFDGGYAGLVAQEDGGGNFCLAVHKSRLADAGSRPERLIERWADACPPLADRLAGAALGRIDAIGAVPYGWRATAGTAGLWRLGDQAAVIPSLAGEGMGIAIASAADAVAAIARGTSAADWQRGFARRVARPMRLAALAWRAAETPALTGPALALLRRAPWLVDVAARLTRVPA